MASIGAVAALGFAACGSDDGANGAASTVKTETTDPAGSTEGVDCSAGAIDETLEPVKVAYLYGDLSGAGAAFDAGDAEGPHNTDREFDALFANLNDRGGICGREVEARGFGVGLEALVDDVALVEVCTGIAEDHAPDFVVDSIVMTGSAAQACFAEHEIALVTMATTLTDPLLVELQPFVTTTFPTVDRIFSALVPTLERVGYLDGATIGVILDDVPELTEPYEAILASALDDVGAEPAALVRVDAADAAAASSAVLRLQDAGVTHVIFIGAVVPFAALTTTAESQGYHPRYAFTDYYAVAATSNDVAPEAQLDDAVVVTSCSGCLFEDASRSSTDLVTPYRPDQLPAGYVECLDILSAELDVDYMSPSVRSTGLQSACDHFALWRDALTAGSGFVEPQDFGAAVESLGDRFESSMIYATDFRDGRQSGAVEFAAAVFDQTCLCYVRATEWEPVAD